MTRLSDWALPGRVWTILAAFGVGVLGISALLSFWIWSNGREADQAAAEAKLDQDKAMCAMINVFLSGPEPVPGPNGDRSRSVRAAMSGYRAALRCSEIQPPVDPGPVRSSPS